MWSVSSLLPPGMSPASRRGRNLRVNKLFIAVVMFLKLSWNLFCHSSYFHNTIIMARRNHDNVIVPSIVCSLKNWRTFFLCRIAAVCDLIYCKIKNTDEWWGSDILLFMYMCFCVCLCFCVQTGTVVSGCVRSVYLQAIKSVITRMSWTGTCWWAHYVTLCLYILTSISSSHWRHSSFSFWYQQKCQYLLLRLRCADEDQTFATNPSTYVSLFLYSPHT